MSDDTYYSHADRDALKPIAWANDEERESFKVFVVDCLEKNGPTHVSELITKHFQTDYLSPMYMGRLFQALIVIGELQREGKLLVPESEYQPLYLPSHQPFTGTTN